MHHLVTEWVTLPASFTCPAPDQVLALLSTWSAPWNRLCFHAKLLEGVGGSLALGPRPGGTEHVLEVVGAPSILPWCMAQIQ